MVAGADVHEAKLEKFKDDINDDVFITTDYLELLAREDIDAVAIFTPDYLHEEHAIGSADGLVSMYIAKSH